MAVQSMAAVEKGVLKDRKHETQNDYTHFYYVDLIRRKFRVQGDLRCLLTHRPAYVM